MVESSAPAEVFSAGEYLEDELRERGWSVSEFAESIGQPARVVSEILNGEKDITPEMAEAFSEALDTTPELWLNLQTAYHQDEQNSAVNTQERR